mgnify:CR=1 FL=1
MSNIIGIIPARRGSQSIKKKNIRDFHGKPLISWTIECALESGLDRVIVSTDDQEIRDIAYHNRIHVYMVDPPSLVEIDDDRVNRSIYISNSRLDKWFADPYC